MPFWIDEHTFIPRDVLERAIKKAVDAGIPVTYEGKIVGKLIGYSVESDGIRLKGRVEGGFEARIEQQELKQAVRQVKELDFRGIILCSKQAMASVSKLISSDTSQGKSVKRAATSKPANRTSAPAP